ncbi:MAG: site-2 protease family protein [Halobacteriota archaeon]|nr:site-2 protease family protein [Halobacteriota archaeon]
MNSYIIGLLLFTIYWALIEVLERKGILKDHGITAYGPIIMIRTQLGQDILSSASRAKRFWRIFANAGVPLMLMSMVSMFLLFLFNTIFLLMQYIRFEELPPAELADPRAMLILPGVNPMLPLSWGIWILIGMVVTIVVHELAHGILCKVEGIDVSSLGLILALIPIGAFVEPDETQLFGVKRGEVSSAQSNEKKIASSGERIRILAAGVMSNFVVAFLAYMLFFGLLTTSIAPVIDGVPIMSVEEGYPAYEVGVEEGMIITSIDGEEIKTLQDFADSLSSAEPDQIVSLEVNSKETFDIKLVSSPHNSSRGIMGVSSGPGTGEFLTFLQETPSKLTSVEGLVVITGLPIIYGFGGFDGIYIDLYEPIGIAASMGNMIFWIVNSLLWIAFINLAAGIFNSLPAVPLDGGHVFRELLNKLVGYFVNDEERKERISNVMTNTLALAILFFILFPFLLRVASMIYSSI